MYPVAFHISWVQEAWPLTFTYVPVPASLAASPHDLQKQMQTDAPALTLGGSRLPLPPECPGWAWLLG